MSDHELYYGDFERDGEEVVKRNLALGLYQSKKGALANEWLARLEDKRNEASSSEQIRTARSAKNAAWAAAIAAIIAAICAIVAMVIQTDWTLIKKIFSAA